MIYCTTGQLLGFVRLRQPTEVLGWVTLDFTSPPSEEKLEAEPGCAGVCHGLVLLEGSGLVWLHPGLAASLWRWLRSSPTYTIGVLSANYFNNGIFLLWCEE